MDWKKLLAYITGSVDQELLLRNEYLVTENRILRNQINGRLRLTDGERKMLADLAKKLGKKASEEVANMFCSERIIFARLSALTSRITIWKGTTKASTTTIRSIRRRTCS